MEVSVVRLRHLGKKLSAEQVKAAQQHHGFMSISYWHLKIGTEDRRVKELALHTSKEVSSPMLNVLPAAEVPSVTPEAITLHWPLMNEPAIGMPL